MFSFLKGLFGSSKNTDTIVETAAKGIYNGLDALVFTEEEKAQYRQQQAETVLEFAKIAYDQNSIRSITRRWLAFMVTAPPTLAAIIGILVYPWYPEYSQFLFSFVGANGLLVGGVLAFYFGPHMISAARR